MELSEICLHNVIFNMQYILEWDFSVLCVYIYMQLIESQNKGIYRLHKQPLSVETFCKEIKSKG